MSRLPKECS